MYPSDIFSETINAVGKKISHKAAVALGNKLLNDKRFVVMAIADLFKTKEIFGFENIQ